MSCIFIISVVTAIFLVRLLWVTNGFQRKKEKKIQGKIVNIAFEIVIKNRQLINTE